MITVVIPLYNKAQSIYSTLQSVCEQSYADVEILVVDDGSTDESAAVASSYQDSRIRVIRKDNGGVSSARNHGIQEARGEFIALLDADDQWDKEYLAEQMRMVEDFPEAATWGINYAELYEGKLIRKLETGLPEGYRGYVEHYFEMPTRVSDLFCSSSVLIRKEVFNKVGMFDERLKYSEDVDMWNRIIANYPVAFYDRYMVWYLYDAENRAMNRKRMLKYWLPYYVDKYKDPLFKKNKVFYRWVMRWAAIKIKYIYFNDQSQYTESKEAMRKLDYTQLHWKYYWLFHLPYKLAKKLYTWDEKRMSERVKE